MYFNQAKLGFTLIELLVVVLIIGILAAVALPQYQQAVLKSRYSTLMNNVKTIVNALEVYYLANGEYPNDDLTGLDIEISGCQTIGDGNFYCNNATYDYFDGNNSNVGGFLTNNLGMGYVQYSVHNVNKPGKRECLADTNNPVANNVCKSLGGTANGASNWRIGAEYGHTTGVWNIYTLP